MVITQYENKKMIISPKSKKIATSCVEVILSAEKGNNIRAPTLVTIHETP